MSAPTVPTWEALHPTEARILAELAEVKASQARIEAMLVEMRAVTVKATDTITKVSEEVMPTIEGLMNNPVIQMALGTKRQSRRERKALGQ